MHRCPWGNLQLFADGGDGGEGAGQNSASEASSGSNPKSVVNAGGDGQQHLRELGVPENVLQESASRRRGKKAAAQTVQNIPATPRQSAAANSHPEDTAKDQAPKMYTQEEVNEMIRKRVKDAQNDAGAAENLAKLAPALSLLAKQQNLAWDPEHPDYDGISNSVKEDKSFYEPYALEWGCSVDEAKERVDEDIMFSNHIEGLKRQAVAMQEAYPGFDLAEEMKNPAFMSMTSPGGGLSLEDAYWAVHRKDLMAERDREMEARIRESMSQSIRSGSFRPVEAGASSQGPSTAKFGGYASMSRPEQEAFVRSLEAAFARGEKVYPNMG